MRRTNTIRDVVMLLAVSMMLAAGCDSTPPSTQVDDEQETRSELQQNFKAQYITEAIPYEFSIDWEKGTEGYSEVLEQPYYEFSLDWASDFNPDALADRHPHRVTYKLIAVPGDQPEFYLLQFLEPGNTKTPDLSWADAGDFTGRVSLFDEAGQQALSTIYSKGEMTDFIPEETKDEFEMWDNTRGKTDTDEMQLVCVTVTTHHCTDWYRVYSDG